MAFWLLTFSLMVILTLPNLIKDGMFMDAMLYTSVSHNLSMGIGTFWFPQFSYHNIAGLSSFHEQPPLVFGIQALFFRFLGDSLYVERIYTFLTMLVSAFMIIFLWREIYKENSTLRKAAWVPVILWISIPVCFWSYSHNMHENTMGIFTLTSVFLSYKSFNATKNSNGYLLLSGFFIFLASMSKGLPGFFPLAVPLLYFFAIRRSTMQNALKKMMVLLLVPLVLYSLLLIFRESRESLSIYFFKRALHRINDVPTVQSHFYIAGRLFMELIPPLIPVVVFLFFSYTRNKKTLPDSTQTRKIIFFLMTGLAGVLPLMLTLVQKGFYFVPALPLFAIGFAMIIAPSICFLIDSSPDQKKRKPYFLAFTVLLFFGSLFFSFSQKGKFSRNADLLHDVYLIGENIPKGSVVSIPPEIWNQWDLQCYLIRYFQISLDPLEERQYLIQDNKRKDSFLKGYRSKGLKTIHFDLFIRE